MSAHDDAINAVLKLREDRYWFPLGIATEMVDAVEPIVRADERERIAQSVRALWHEQCSGYQSMSCESCRAYDDVLTYAIARGEQP